MCQRSRPLDVYQWAEDTSESNVSLATAVPATGTRTLYTVRAARIIGMADSIHKSVALLPVKTHTCARTKFLTGCEKVETSGYSSPAVWDLKLAYWATNYGSTWVNDFTDADGTIVSIPCPDNHRRAIDLSTDPIEYMCNKNSGWNFRWTIVNPAYSDGCVPSMLRFRCHTCNCAVCNIPPTGEYGTNSDTTDLVYSDTSSSTVIKVGKTVTVTCLPGYFTQNGRDNQYTLTCAHQCDYGGCDGKWDNIKWLNKEDCVPGRIHSIITNLTL